MIIRKNQRKSKIGIVTSNKTDKTVVVAVQTKAQHWLYKKFIKKTSKFMAHDPTNTCQLGDKVSIRETRPLSRLKRWRVEKIFEKTK